MATKEEKQNKELVEFITNSIEAGREQFFVSEDQAIVLTKAGAEKMLPADINIQIDGTNIVIDTFQGGQIKLDMKPVLKGRYVTRHKEVQDTIDKMGAQELFATSMAEYVSLGQNFSNNFLAKITKIVSMNIIYLLLDEWKDVHVDDIHMDMFTDEWLLAFVSEQSKIIDAKCDNNDFEDFQIHIMDVSCGFDGKLSKGLVGEVFRDIFLLTMQTDSMRSSVLSVVGNTIEQLIQFLKVEKINYLKDIKMSASMGCVNDQYEKDTESK